MTDWKNLKFSEPITAYRLWNAAHADNGKLSSLTKPDVWDKGIKEAEHLYPGDDGEFVGFDHLEDFPPESYWVDRDRFTTNVIPVPHCDCGIYSYREFSDVLNDPVNFRSDRYRNMTTLVLGTVEIGGTVMPHQFGWRSQYAMITGIYDLSPIDVGPMTKALVLDENPDHVALSTGQQISGVTRLLRPIIDDASYVRTIDSVVSERYDVPLIEFPKEFVEPIRRNLTQDFNQLTTMNIKTSMVGETIAMQRF